MNDYENDGYCQMVMLVFSILTTLIMIVSGGIILGIAKNDILAIALGFGFEAFGGICGIISVLEYLKIKKGKNKNETK